MQWKLCELVFLASYDASQWQIFIDTLNVFSLALTIMRSLKQHTPQKDVPRTKASDENVSKFSL